MRKIINQPSKAQDNQNRELQKKFLEERDLSLSADLAQQLLEQQSFLIKDNIFIQDKETQEIWRVPPATALKTLELSLVCPESEMYPLLLKKIKTSYLEEINKGTFVTYWANIFPDITYQYFTNQLTGTGLEEYPLVPVWEGLHQEVTSLFKNPNNMTDLFSYWKDNISILDIDDLSYTELKKISPFRTPKMRENSHIYISQINFLRKSISDALVEFFYYYPQKQLKLTQGFPGYYQIIEWADNDKHNVYKKHFTQEHIDVLKQYKDTEGYEKYIDMTFYPGAAQTIALRTMLANPVKWDDLFGDSAGILEPTLAEHYNKLKTENNEALINEVLAIYNYTKLQLDLPTKKKTTKSKI